VPLAALVRPLVIQLLHLATIVKALVTLVKVLVIVVGVLVV